MALTVLSDLLPYEQYFRTGYIEGVNHMIDLFNSGSNGTILLEGESTTGTKKNTAFFKDFGTISRRDITVDSAQSSHKIERAEHTAFKTFWKFEPVEWMWTAFKTSDGMSNEEVVMMVARKLAEKKTLYNINQAINIAAAAIESNGRATVLDLATTGKSLTVDKLVNAQAKFGDQASNLSCLVMHSAVYFAMVKNQMVNYQFDTGAGIVLYGGTPATMNKPVVVTDAPELVYTATDGVTPLYKTLFLSPGAVTIRDNGETKVGLQDVLGYENMKSIFQAEGDMWNYVKGYQLKSTANPASNPALSVLADPANWEQWVNSVKLTAGVVIKSAADIDAEATPINVKIVS